MKNCKILNLIVIILISPLFCSGASPVLTDEFSVLTGDLLKLADEGHFDVIVHGCNCQHAMGGGIAGQIRSKFPKAKDADFNTFKGDREKLGTYSSATMTTAKGNRLTIVNAYTQFNGGKAPREDKLNENIRSVFKQVKEDFPGARIGFPRIGAGIAGGDWDEIYTIIKEELEGADFTLVEYSSGNQQAQQYNPVQNTNTLSSKKKKVGIALAAVAGVSFVAVGTALLYKLCGNSKKNNRVYS